MISLGWFSWILFWRNDDSFEQSQAQRIADIKEVEALFASFKPEVSINGKDLLWFQGLVERRITKDGFSQGVPIAIREFLYRRPGSTQLVRECLTILSGHSRFNAEVQKEISEDLFPK